MSSDSERLDRNERRNSLAAFLRAIKFRTPKPEATHVERDMARLHPRTPQSPGVGEDNELVRSAN